MCAMGSITDGRGGCEIPRFPTSHQRRAQNTARGSQVAMPGASQISPMTAICKAM
jgi:hypothetical protein